ncbi:cell wall protein DAN4-like [Teleopsis dalmanni]|uniref:cell wall protein DAN4-like n=1 Tax=Teleopsis dalmanni TaxID=139649 RepID=UPI000D32C92F|nr:cell wall protein DAN4-like [Teleopsis dalmanni]
MFWRTAKDKPKESTSTEIVRQDPRTSVKTTTAQTETTNTTVQNATIFNNNTRTVTYQTTRQTVTRQQQATVTEILTRRTPTSEELEQMLQQMGRPEINSRRRSGNFQTKPTGNSASNNGNGISSKSMPKFKTTTSPGTRSPFNYDSHTAFGVNSGSSSTGAGMRYRTTPTTPTLVKTEETTVTTKNGRTVTTSVEKQRIKLDDIKLSSPNSPLTVPAILPKSSNYTFNNGKASVNSSLNTSITRPAGSLYTTSSLSSNSLTPVLIKSDARPTNTTIKPTNINNKVTINSSVYSTPSTYVSPYTNRITATAPPTTRITTTVKPTFTSTTGATKLATNSNYNPISVFGNEFKSSTAAPTTKSSYTPGYKSTTSTYSTPSSTPFTMPNISPNTSNTSLASTKKKSKLKPGYAYIFNNDTFDNPENEFRDGSSNDVKSLKEVFEMFKLNVNVIKNATLDKIDSTVNNIERKKFTDYSCLIIVILSHGSRHEGIAAKNGTYSIDDKILFPILRNRTLADKPKIFFIQACKGAMEIGGFKTDSVQPNGTPSEILKCYSTFEGYVSYRLKDGSFFIQTLCESLKMHGQSKDIKNIMDEVLRLVKERTNNMQIPSLTTTLTIPFVFGDYC